MRMLHAVRGGSCTERAKHRAHKAIIRGTPHANGEIVATWPSNKTLRLALKTSTVYGTDSEN